MLKTLKVTDLEGKIPSTLLQYLLECQENIFVSLYLFIIYLFIFFSFSFDWMIHEEFGLNKKAKGEYKGTPDNFNFVINKVETGSMLTYHCSTDIVLDPTAYHLGVHLLSNGMVFLFD